MRSLYYLLIFSLLIFSCSEKKKTNIVFVLVDDLGWTDLGYTGSTFYETPNIDSLSGHSIQFTNAYSASPVCSPARASIMTGKHPARINITDWIPGMDPKDEKLLGAKDLNELPLAEVTISEIFKNAGYETFFAGKWHLGGDGFYPEDQGFDINIGGHEKGQPPGGYYSPYNNPKLADGPDGEYLTDRLTDESVKFLNNVGDNPFFLFLSYYTVHTPIQANKRHIVKFKEKASELGKEENLLRTEGNGITTLVQRNPEYASMVYALDENVGELITALKKKGLYENTIIVFTSDNGGLSTHHNRFNSIAPTSVFPLRAGKGWLYEGGIRVPLLIKPANYQEKNVISSEPVIGHDLYPTLLSLAGIQSDEKYQIDGVDLSPLFGRTNNLSAREFYWHYPHYHGSGWTPGAAIRQGDWKLIEFYETDHVELYNLAEDISEKNNLSNQYPEKVLELQKKLHDLQKSMNANKVTINNDYKIAK